MIEDDEELTLDRLKEELNYTIEALNAVANVFGTVCNLKDVEGETLLSAALRQEEERKNASTE